MKKPHQKHTVVKRPDLGIFGRNEASVLGTNCGDIKRLAYHIIKRLSSLQISYVDADHKGDNEQINQASALEEGAIFQYTDKIRFKRFDFTSDLNDFYIKQYFADTDLVLVNGNHFKASHQIVVVDDAKPLEKKLEKIVNPVAVVLKNEGSVVPGYLEEHLSKFQSVPVFRWDEFDKIADLFLKMIESRVPKLKGLVLAGGKSSRMKKDKALLEYHGKNQILHSHEMLSSLCEHAYISCPHDQKDKIPEGLDIIEDAFYDLGPYGAILSAFRSDPDAAWAVIACDLPFLNKETLFNLIENRDPSKAATAYKGTDDFPEPLITIWEPKSYQKLLFFLGLGYTCPRKVLINSDCKILEAPDQKALLNVNYPEEYERAKSELETLKNEDN